MDEYTWGDDVVLLDSDINLLRNFEFDRDGHGVIDIDDYNPFLRNFIQEEIYKITSKRITIESYHSEITETEHAAILHNMPYKKNDSEALKEFSMRIEEYVSSALKQKVRIFNDDIWVRICRPTHVSNNDYNPCHKDVYLDFYRNMVNIYLPICGSNENSSLLMESGSHKWNEKDTIATKGGAYFKKENKKYSVDTIVASKKPLNMIRPNPSTSQMIIFSPYLIHGCSLNTNKDETRMSLEIRFILDAPESCVQEKEFNEFLKTRVWR